MLTQTKHRGFTLVEMMVAMVILITLLSISMPAMQSIVANNKLRSYANSLVASAYLARSEAIKTNSVIKMCASSDGAACNGEWGQGWVVLNNKNVVIQSHGAVAYGYKISGTNATINFQPTGMGATQTTLTVCGKSSAGGENRVVSIGATGKPSVTRTTGGSC